MTAQSFLFALLLSGSALSAITTKPNHARVAHLGRAEPEHEQNSTKAAPDVAAAWYASWHASNFTLEEVSWKKYTHMTYAFAETAPDGSLNITDEALLPQFVEAAQNNSVKALVSIGGWTGSRFFSTSVGDAANRTAFVQTVVDMVQNYSLDGVDFDWEYPNKQGIGCNTIDKNDTANLLEFLRELRQHPAGANLTITAATSIFPYNNETDQPSTNVSGFAEVYDYLSIMNYDLWGSWSTAVGPNGPLADSCADAENQQGSATAAVDAWIAAGFPAEKLVLAVPSYGHSFTVNASAAFVEGSKKELAPYPAFDAEDKPEGDSWDDEVAENVCGVTEGPGGVWQFWGLIEAGFLTDDGVPAAGIAARFDNCSQTPFVYNETTSMMVSYDDAQSFAAKGEFIKTRGLKGFSMWEAGGDWEDILLDSIRKASGMPEIPEEEEDC
jgi:chitinase